MTSTILGRSGELMLPLELQERYGLKPETPVRLIETRGGILVVPLTDEPMSAALAQELEQWQSLGGESWTQFAYEDEAA